jgi:glycosyltransferase involved in cell wall biosynthesis
MVPTFVDDAMIDRTEPPRHILHLVDHWDPFGLAAPLDCLAAAQHAAGHQVETLVLDQGEWSTSVSPERPANLPPPRSLHRRWPVDPIAAASLVRALGRGFDVVHAWGTAAALYAAALRPLHAGGVWVASLAGDSLGGLASRTGETSVSRWRRAQWAFLRRRFDRLVGLDSLTARWAESTGAARDISGPWLPARVPSKARARDRHALQAELDIAAGTRWIVVASPLIRERRLDDPIWCFELVRVLHPTARLLVIGDGPDRLRLERFARLVCEAGTVCFAGKRLDWWEFLVHSEVIWEPPPGPLPSPVLATALGLGIPVVADDCPVHREAVGSAAHGVLVPAGNRAKWARATDVVLSDRQERQERAGPPDDGSCGATPGADRPDPPPAATAWDSIYAPCG